MKFFNLALVVLSLCSVATTSMASVRLGNLEANACEIISPFSLEKSERTVIERKGYSLRVVRHLYIHSRFNAVYEDYRLKANALTDGDIFLKAVIVPSYRNQFVLSKRTFMVNLKMAKGDLPLIIATTVPPFLARSNEETELANFSDLPVCTVQN